jgi:hypothetical protein
MEEITGSIPVRSANQFNRLAHPPAASSVANSKTLPETDPGLISSEGAKDFFAVEDVATTTFGLMLAALQV